MQTTTTSLYLSALGIMANHVTSWQLIGALLFLIIYNADKTGSPSPDHRSDAVAGPKSESA